MKIEPRKESDRGGWLCMPLVASVPVGKEGWKKSALPGMRSVLLEKTGGCRSDSTQQT